MLKVVFCLKKELIGKHTKQTVVFCLKKELTRKCTWQTRFCLIKYLEEIVIVNGDVFEQIIYRKIKLTKVSTCNKSNCAAKVCVIRMILVSVLEPGL